MSAQVWGPPPGRLAATRRAGVLLAEFRDPCPALGEALRRVAGETGTEHLAGDEWSTRRYLRALGVSPGVS